MPGLGVRSTLLALLLLFRLVKTCFFFGRYGDMDVGLLDLIRCIWAVFICVYSMAEVWRFDFR